jgi:hypothetical protein
MTNVKEIIFLQKQQQRRKRNKTFTETKEMLNKSTTETKQDTGCVCLTSQLATDNTCLDSPKKVLISF